MVVRHWDGTAWRAVTPPKAYINSPLDQGAGPVVATSASNAWIFAARGTQSVDYTDVLHWTGRKWANPVRLNTAIQAAVAPSAAAVWAFGPPARYMGIAAIGPRDVWADAVTYKASGTVSYLLHWNGRSWTRTTIPYRATADSPVVPDGHGGLWLAVNIGAGRQLTFWFFHYSGGHWTKTPMPRTGTPPTGQIFVTQIAWIPRTRSLWATGNLLANVSTAILKYGP